LALDRSLPNVSKSRACDTHAFPPLAARIELSQRPPSPGDEGDDEIAAPCSYPDLICRKN